jgi:hypothetical protein
MECSVWLCRRTVKSAGMCAHHLQRKYKGRDLLEPLKTHCSEATEAFINAAVLAETGECIIWPYSKTQAGYPMAVSFGEKVMVTREVLLRRVGSPPNQNMEAAHCPNRCSSTSCVNPYHLRWATRQENIDDKAVAGTVTFGEANGNAKLTESDVRLIRNSSDKLKPLARRFGVSESLISMVRSRKVWGHIS